MSNDQTNFLLPIELVTSTELSRTITELKSIEEFFLQARIRTPGKSLGLPSISHPLQKLCELNNLNLLDNDDRSVISANLSQIKQKQVKIHVSFAVESNPTVNRKLVSWFRENIHPYTVLEIGLRPNIVAGCVIRSSNKIFDMSLRAKFDKNKMVMASALGDKGE